MNIKDPSYNYDENENNYSNYRQTDPRIYQYIKDALGTAHTVLNVGAGSGSYEPDDRYVIAVEPSHSMREQRMQNNRPPAVIGLSDTLPFDSDSFDASMATLTVHQWTNLEEGLTELRRVTRNQVIIMTYDPDALDVFWNRHYFPELIEVERNRFPKLKHITEILGGTSIIKEIPIPLDCQDGFLEAFYGRPEAFLNKEIRQSQSAWGFISDDTEKNLVKKLANDLHSGKWEDTFGFYRNMPFLKGGLRLIISTAD